MDWFCGILGKNDVELITHLAHKLGGQSETFHLCEGKTYAVASSKSIQNLILITTYPTKKIYKDLDLIALKNSISSNFCKKNTLSIPEGIALVIGNEEEDRWILLRDRLGFYPFYYYEGENFVLFSSQISTFKDCGFITPRLNLASVDCLLTLGFCPSPYTIFQGVAKLPAGYQLFVEHGKVVGSAPVEKPIISSKYENKEKAAIILKECLEESVKNQQTEYLLFTGGLDSAALAKLSGNCIPVFVILERAWQDELKKAKDAAKLLKLSLDLVSARRFSEELFRFVLKSLEEPVADVSVFPLSMIMEQASKVSPTFMIGIGADELLGGYTRFRYFQKAHAAQNFIPASMIEGLLPSLPPNALMRRGGRYLAYGKDIIRAYLSFTAIFDKEEREDLYTEAMKSATQDVDFSREAIKQYFTSNDVMQNIASLDIRLNLPELLIAPSMQLCRAFGIELLFPYLHDSLIDFAIGLPHPIKYGVRSKPLLRLAMKGILPASLRLRAQRKFRIPQSGRSAAVIDMLAEKIITRERVDSTGIFRWQQVEHIVRSASYNVVRKRQFWALLMLLGWYKENFES